VRILIGVPRRSRGKPWHSIATGVWPAEPLPPRLITALNRHPNVFGPTIGTWNYTVGNANYVDK
jgi:hypothetical protein